MEQLTILWQSMGVWLLFALGLAVAQAVIAYVDLAVRRIDIFEHEKRSVAILKFPTRLSSFSSGSYLDSVQFDRKLYEEQLPQKLTNEFVSMSVITSAVSTIAGWVSVILSVQRSSFPLGFLGFGFIVLSLMHIAYTYSSLRKWKAHEHKENPQDTGINL